MPRPARAVLRRFWARHPRLVDVLVAVLAVLLSLPAATVRSSYPTPATPGQVWFAIILVLLGGAALVPRRRWPLAALAVAAAPLLLLPPSLVTTLEVVAAFALYAVAVYRSVRACWVSLGALTAASLVYGALALLGDPAALTFHVSSVVSWTVSLLLGALIGTNVGNRRRYLLALIDRSRQLAVERDQQGALAAAAERTRIAREMHDIVSHSLTVVVALSEGAAAAATPERARQASLASAETARSALEEMRAMLGVLRDASESGSPLEPLEPVDPADVVATAQRAGFPVVAEVTGDITNAPRPLRFALGRVVQEAVTNAMRHAPDAHAVRVSVRVDETGIDVLVDDDGAPAETPTAGGYGLRGLRERVEIAGGTLHAGRRRDGGWRVQARLPFEASRREERP